jgi:hypothetical protein
MGFVLGVGKREAAPGRAVAKRDADELRDIEAVLACLGAQEHAGQRAEG